MIALILIYLLKAFQSTYNTLGHGEYNDNCHWQYTEYTIQCPIKHDNFSSCVGNNIDIDTVK